MTPPLAGTRVLELAEGISGPFCGRLLAGFGAEVIKVERPAGDPARVLPPFPDDRPDREASGTFLVLNTGKQGVTLDWRTTTGRGLLWRLLDETDIVLESGGLDDLVWLGLDDERLAAGRPALVVTSITPFGLSGPYREYGYSEAVVTAAGGLMSMQGEPEREPLKNGGTLAAMGAGLNAYVATCAALFYRQRFGDGDHIDISVFDHIATVLETHVQRAINDGIPTRRVGNRASKAGGLFPAETGHVSLVLDYRRDVAHVGQAFDIPELTSERYDDYIFGRAKHIDEIGALVEMAMHSGPAEEVYHRAQTKHLPSGFVNYPEDLVRSGQLNFRGFWSEVDHPVAGRLTYPNAPFKMSEGEWRTLPAPLLGEHNQQVFVERLGLSPQDLSNLRAAGVV